jgi:hypothetical protein
MFTIISLIVSYNPHNYYVPIVVKELRKKSKVILFTTDKPNFEVDDLFIYDKSIGENLVYEPRKWIIDNLESNWDYVLYNEDDILILDSVLSEAIKTYQNLPSGFAPGFARYEFITEDNKRYIDLDPSNSVHRGGSTIIKHVHKDIEMFEPWNLHSGNFIFSKKDIQSLFHNNKIEKYFLEHELRYGNCGPLETTASVLYSTITKVLPKDVSSVSVHHLPNKYINMQHIQGDKCGPGKLDIINEYESK